MLRKQNNNGEIELIDEYDPKRHNSTCVTSIWKSALEAAKRKEKEYGKEELGPWDNFEWGMLNGKQSALRWALGDEWDMLDN